MATLLWAAGRFALTALQTNASRSTFLSKNGLFDVPRSFFRCSAGLNTGREKLDRSQLQFATLAVTSRVPPPSQPPLVAPIYATSVYCPKDADEANATMHGEGYIYSRWQNPTVDLAAQAIAELEGAHSALLFASGMNAISTALMAFVKAGDHVVAPKNCYSGTVSFIQDVFPRMGVEYTFVETDVDAYRQAVRPNTKVLYGETPANPTMELLDMEKFALLGKELNGVVTMVDSTFASPYCQQPIKHGVDMSIHSCTKYLGGHSDLTAGVVSVREKHFFDALLAIRKIVGGVQSPFEAFLLHRAVKTLHVRMDRHCSNALSLAKFLDVHPKVEIVHYPGLESHPGHEIAKRQLHGFGGMISFQVRGGAAAAKKLAESTKLIILTVSLGGVESLIEHAGSMTHDPGMMSLFGGQEEAGVNVVPDNLLRLSVGLEDIADLTADLEQALSCV